MAQAVQVTIEYEEGAGLPGSVNRETDALPPDLDGKVGAIVTVPLYADEAVVQTLTRLHKAGFHFDGELTIRTEKVRQVGGDDGSSFSVRGLG